MADPRTVSLVTGWEWKAQAEESHRRLNVSSVKLLPM